MSVREVLSPKGRARLSRPASQLTESSMTVIISNSSQKQQQQARLFLKPEIINWTRSMTTAPVKRQDRVPSHSRPRRRPMIVKPLNVHRNSSQSLTVIITTADNLDPINGARYVAPHGNPLILTWSTWHLASAAEHCRWRPPRRWFLSQWALDRIAHRHLQVVG